MDLHVDDPLQPSLGFVQREPRDEVGQLQGGKVHTRVEGIDVLRQSE